MYTGKGDLVARSRVFRVVCTCVSNPGVFFTVSDYGTAVDLCVLIDLNSKMARFLCIGSTADDTGSGKHGSVSLNYLI